MTRCSSRARRGVLAVPVLRDDRLPDRAPAGDPRRRAPARTGDDRRRGAAGGWSTRSARTATTRCNRTTALSECIRKLKERCCSCSKPIDPAWRICPSTRRTRARPRRPPRRASAGARRGSSRRSRPRRRSPRPPRQTPNVAARAQTTLTDCPGHGTNSVLVKPDAFARRLTEEIIARFERKGLKIVAAEHMTGPGPGRAALPRARGQAVLRRLIDFVASGPDRRARAGGPGRHPRRPQVIGATPARGAPGRSAATSRSRSARTWSTARSRPRVPASAKAALYLSANFITKHASAGPIIRPEKAAFWSWLRQFARRHAVLADELHSQSSSDVEAPRSVASPGGRAPARPPPVPGRLSRSARTRSSPSRRRPRQAARHHPRRASSSGAYSPSHQFVGGPSRSSATATIVAAPRSRSPRSTSARRATPLLDWYVATRRVAGPRRRIRDPGCRSRARRGDRGRLPQRGRPAARPPAGSSAGANRALRGQTL